MGLPNNIQATPAHMDRAFPKIIGIIRVEGLFHTTHTAMLLT